MARCWTCGALVATPRYRCSQCETLMEVRKHRVKAEDLIQVLRSDSEVVMSRLGVVESSVKDGLHQLADDIKWAFEQIAWQFELENGILRSIDQTLKRPGETKAKEWRKQAEELMQRGQLEDAEEFFQKALNEYRLDYRAYVGLAQTYLQMGRFDEARVLLEKSLPHAPKAHTDYRSYSLKLIGHIYACLENYEQAASVLETAIELSPSYVDAKYDYAQYCAQLGRSRACLSSLREAILANPIYWHMSHGNRNFGPLSEEVEELLRNLREEARSRAENRIEDAESSVRVARDAVQAAELALRVARERSKLESPELCEKAEEMLSVAKREMEEGLYVAYLRAAAVADGCEQTARAAFVTAREEGARFVAKRKEKVKNAWKRVPGAVLGWPLLGAITGFFLGALGSWITGSDVIAWLLFVLPITGGFVFGARNVWKELN